MISVFMEIFQAFDKKIIPVINNLAGTNVTPQLLEKEINKVPGWVQDGCLTYLEKREFISIIESNGSTEIEINKQMSKWDLLNSFTYVTTHSLDTSPINRLNAVREISNRYWEN